MVRLLLVAIPTVTHRGHSSLLMAYHCPFYVPMDGVQYRHGKGRNPTEYTIQTEGSIVKFASISSSEKFWEIIYASVCLEGAEREEALKRLQVPANPVNA